MYDICPVYTHTVYESAVVLRYHPRCNVFVPLVYTHVPFQCREKADNIATVAQIILARHKVTG